MPQLNAYPLQTTLAGADIVIFWNTATGAVKSMTVTNLASQLGLLQNGWIPVREINVNYVSTGIRELIVGNSGSSLTFTLPPTMDYPGLPLYVANKGAGTLVVYPNGAETIDGAVSVNQAQYTNNLYISNGTGMWHNFT